MTGAIHGVVSLDSHLTGVPYTMRFALREVCIEVCIEVHIEKGLHCKVCMARSTLRGLHFEALAVDHLESASGTFKSTGSDFEQFWNRFSNLFHKFSQIGMESLRIPSNGHCTIVATCCRMEHSMYYERWLHVSTVNYWLTLCTATLVIVGTSEYYSLSSRFIAVYRNLNRKIPTVSQYERTQQFDHRNSSTPLEVRRGVSHLLGIAHHHTLFGHLR